MALPDGIKELHQQLNTTVHKYTYFLLAVSAAAVAYAIKLTTGSILSYSMLPLGLAILNWGLSFYSGCRQLNYVHSYIFTNFELLKIKGGVHEDVGNHPQMIEEVSKGIRDILKSYNDKINFYGRWQFRFLVIGSLLFLTWHIIEMIIRTISK